jgi:hypothetical protein
MAGNWSQQQLQEQHVTTSKVLQRAVLGSNQAATCSSQLKLHALLLGLMYNCTWCLMLAAACLRSH